MCVWLAIKVVDAVVVSRIKARKGDPDHSSATSVAAGFRVAVGFEAAGCIRVCVLGAMKHSKAICLIQFCLFNFSIVQFCSKSGTPFVKLCQYMLVTLM